MQEQSEFSAVSLPNNVADAIRDNLPQQVGSLLRELLVKGKRATEENETLKKDNRALDKRVDSMAIIKRAQKDLDDRAEGIQRQETMFYEKSMEFNDTVLTIRLEYAEKYAAKLEGALAGLVRNTEWRESVFRGHTDEYGSNGEISKVEISCDTTKTAE